MNDDVVRVARTDSARTARAPRAELVLPPLIVDAGPAAVGKFLEFFAARIANRRTRAAYGLAVGQFLAWCEARGLGAPGGLAAARGGLYPDPPRVGAHRQAAPGGPPHARRLARRQPGPAGEPGGGRPGAEARGDAGRDAGALAGRGAPAPRGDRPGHARRPARPGARLGDDQAAGGGGGSPALDLLPHVPGDGDHSVSVDATTGLDLLTAVKGPLVRVTADAASDTVAVYETAPARGATVIIPPAKTANLSGHGPRSPARDRTITLVKQLGRRRWKKVSGYHRQARVENTFFRYKSIIGDGLRARSPAGQGSEAVLGCEILNRMTALGRPVSYRIGR